MSAHRTLKDMYRAFEATGPGRLADPGDTETITVTMYGQICSVVTATTETRTLAQPDRPGIIATVCLAEDGGDLTLTVTGGYNQDADTVMTFADAGDFVTFISIEVGTSYYWRVFAPAEELVIPSASASNTPSSSVSNTPSTSPSASVSNTPSASVSNTVSRTPSASVSNTPSASISNTPSTSPSAT